MVISKHEPERNDITSLCVDPYFSVVDPFISVQPASMVMKAEQSAFRTFDWHKICTWVWKPDQFAKPASQHETLVCAHGFFRNGRDFDFLGSTLSHGGWQVVCPDMPGRGGSDDLSDPRCYSYPQYMIDSMAILASLGGGQVNWLGTSMGGLLGMMLAAEPKTPIRRLIMNDVGAAAVPQEAREYIATYAAANPAFSTIDELADYLGKVYVAWNLTRDKWLQVAGNSSRPRPDGKIGIAYDPKLGQQLIAQMLELDRTEAAATAGLLFTWSRVTCPVLVIHGGESRVLTGPILQKMRELKPQIDVITIPNCGHAPPLMDDEQVSQVREWLERTAAQVDVPEPAH